MKIRYGLIAALFVAQQAAAAITFIGAGATAADNVPTTNPSINPTVHASTTTGDLILCPTYYRQGDVTPAATGYTDILHFGTNNETVVLAKIAASGSEPGPTITAAGGTGTSLLSQCVTYRGAQASLTGIVAASNVESNGSQQDIDYEGLTVPIANSLTCAVGRKGDDWTGVDPIAGFTERIDFSTTLGADAGLVLDCQIQTIATNVTAGAFTVTGGAAATGGSATFSIRPALVAPTFSAGPTLGTMTATTAPTTFTVTPDATVYGVACPDGQTAPTIAQVKAANCTGDVAAVSAWSEATVESVSDGHTFTGLTQSTIYDLSLVATNAAGDSTLQALANATTICGGTPSLSSVSVDDVLTATETGVVVAGSNLCNTHATAVLVFRDANSVDHTITCSGWTDTQWTGCAVSGIGMGVVGGSPYGAFTARLTNDAGNTGTRAITVNPPSGTVSANITTPVTLVWDEFGSPNRPYGYPLDEQSGSQYAIRNVAGCTLDSLFGAADTGNGNLGVDGDEDDIWPRTDGSLVAGSTCSAVDFDFTRDGVYLGTVNTLTFKGTPPLWSGLVMPDQLYAMDSSVTPYDLDDYLALGEAALTAFSQPRLTTASSVDQVNGAVTDSKFLLVDDVTGIDVGVWIRCGASAYTRVQVVDPFNNKLHLDYPITCADNDTVSTMGEGTWTLSGLAINGSTHSVGGTVDIAETNPLSLFRITDAAGLTADISAPIDIDVAEIDDWVGDTSSNAISGITAQGFGSPGIVTQCDAVESAGTVLSQNVSSIPWTSLVDLLVSSGPCGNAPKRLWPNFRIQQ